MKFVVDNNSGSYVPQELIMQQSLPFIKEEIANAVLQMKNLKCPLLDGISIDLYKMFWKFLAEAFYSMLTYAFSQGTLSKGMRTGLINLIPKAKKDSRFLSNLRPITLLNLDYKIIEKTIANRLIPALNVIINL